MDAEDGVEVDFRDGLPSGGGGPPGNVLGEQRLLGGDGGDGRHERLGWKRRSGGLRNTRCGRRGFEGEGEDVEEEVVEEYAAPLMQPQDERSQSFLDQVTNILSHMRKFQNGHPNFTEMQNYILFFVSAPLYFTLSQQNFYAFSSR